MIDMIHIPEYLIHSTESQLIIFSEIGHSRFQEFCSLFRMNLLNKMEDFLVILF